MKRKYWIPASIFLALGLTLTACQGNTPQVVKTTQSQKAQQAADSLVFSANAEIDNIKKRLELTSDPALTGYVLLLNQMGQPIYYTAITGKITSSGKRLTPKVKQYDIDRGQYSGTALGPAPSDEGTHGSSSPYIYFWDTNGQYFQWSGEYLYSDRPFRTSIEPLVIATESKLPETTE